MKSLVLLIFVIGIMMATIGYHQKLLEENKTKTIIQYRYIPRSQYEEQLQGDDVHGSFYDMFSKDSVFFQRV